VQIFSADLRNRDCWVKGYPDARYMNKHITGYKAVKRGCSRRYPQIKEIDQM